MTRRSLAPLAVLILAVSGVLPVWADGPAPSATTSVPGTTPPILTTTPMSEPTVEGATSTPFPVPTSTLSIPVKQEQSAPLATALPPPTEVTVPTLVVPTGTALPTPGQTVGVPASPGTPDAPLPSPRQLQIDARLRWGDRVPDSVRRWAFLIVPAAKKYGVDPDLVAAVMTMESNGDPLAWSSADARGLMQILHGPWDPKENIYQGTRLLRRLIDEFGSTDLALAAYNAGEGAVIQYHGIPPYQETRDYVIIVHYLYDLYHHHKLSTRRTAKYRKTLTDLRHFKNQKGKIAHLAAIARVKVDTASQCFHFSDACGRPAPSLYDTRDPFWPLPGVPDPLQRVEPPPA